VYNSAVGEAVPHWHMGKCITKHHRQSCLSMEKMVTCMRESQRTSLSTSAKLKRLFQNHHPTQTAVSETWRVYHGNSCYA